MKWIEWMGGRIHNSRSIETLKNFSKKHLFHLEKFLKEASSLIYDIIKKIKIKNKSVLIDGYRWWKFWRKNEFIKLWHLYNLTTMKPSFIEIVGLCAYSHITYSFTITRYIPFTAIPRWHITFWQFLHLDDLNFSYFLVANIWKYFLDNAIHTILLLQLNIVPLDLKVG